jgi:hypothetical protein
MQELVKENKNYVLEGDKNLIVKEGDEIHSQDWILIGNEPSTRILLQLKEIDDSSDPGTFEDVLTNVQYGTVWSDDGVGTLVLGEQSYTVNMQDGAVTLDYPQTTGDEELDLGKCFDDPEYIEDLQEQLATKKGSIEELESAGEEDIGAVISDVLVGDIQCIDSDGLDSHNAGKVKFSGFTLSPLSEGKTMTIKSQNRIVVDFNLKDGIEGQELELTRNPKQRIYAIATSLGPFKIGIREFNYYGLGDERNNVVFSILSAADFCQNEDILIEATCEPSEPKNPLSIYKEIRCEYGCEDSHCLTKEESERGALARLVDNAIDTVVDIFTGGE